MTTPVKQISLTVNELFALCHKLKDRHLGDNVLSARSGSVDLVITDVVSIPSEGRLVFEVAEERSEPMVLGGPIKGRIVEFPHKPDGEAS